MTYPIPESLSDTHEGAEWALAAILGDRLVGLLYLSTVAPALVEHLDTPSSEFVIKRWVQTAPADLRELQALGDVSAGIVTEDGFEARWQLAEWQPGDQLPERSAS
ncbi:hypothetical protein BOTU111921_11495 [Bordetella tumbae]|uniref:hypothetical protein n=1 Tax=Bordetella tumbae TaxID=1649139 RepID=UPI0039F07E95